MQGVSRLEKINTRFTLSGFANYKRRLLSPLVGNIFYCILFKVITQLLVKVNASHVKIYYTFYRNIRKCAIETLNRKLAIFLFIVNFQIDINITFPMM